MHRRICIFLFLQNGNNQAEAGQANQQLDPAQGPFQETLRTLLMTLCKSTISIEKN
jgi:hypothetical protein